MVEKQQLVKVKSKQPSITARHYGEPSYEVIFGDDGIASVRQEVADHLVTQPGDRFSIVGKTTAKTATKKTSNSTSFTEE